MPSHYKLCNYSHNKKQMSELYPLYIHYTRMYIWETWTWVAFRSTMAESTMRTGPFRKCQCPSICWCRSSNLQLCAHRHFWREGLEEKKKARQRFQPESDKITNMNQLTSQSHELSLYQSNWTKVLCQIAPQRKAVALSFTTVRTRLCLSDHEVAVYKILLQCLAQYSITVTFKLGTSWF